jgi:hypothetical protein
VSDFVAVNEFTRRVDARTHLTLHWQVPTCQCINLHLCQGLEHLYCQLHYFCILTVSFTESIWQPSIWSTNIYETNPRNIHSELQNTTFRKLSLFPSSGHGGRHLLCWVCFHPQVMGADTYCVESVSILRWWGQTPTVLSLFPSSGDGGRHLLCWVCFHHQVMGADTYCVESVSILRWWGKTPTVLSPLEKVTFNHSTK